MKKRTATEFTFKFVDFFVLKVRTISNCSSESSFILVIGNVVVVLTPTNSIRVLKRVDDRNSPKIVQEAISKGLRAHWYTRSEKDEKVKQGYLECKNNVYVMENHILGAKHYLSLKEFLYMGFWVLNLRRCCRGEKVIGKVNSWV